MQDNNTNGRTPYTHIAYATSADGSSGFSITDSEGKTYLGYYADYMAEDSNLASSYTWTPIVVEQEQEQEASKKRVIPTEHQPNIGKKRIPKWVQWVIAIMVTGAIGFNFAGLAIGVVLWLMFDWINGDL